MAPCCGMAPISPPAGLLSISTAPAPHDMPQADAARIARRLFQDRFPAFDRMLPVFETAGIDRRQMAMPLDWYLEPREWPERTQAYLDVGVSMFVAAAKTALEEAELRGVDVDVIVTVSSTGIATPSFEARAMRQMGFRPDTARIPVFGLVARAGRPAWRWPASWRGPRPAPWSCWWSWSFAPCRSAWRT